MSADGGELLKKVASGEVAKEAAEAERLSEEAVVPSDSEASEERGTSDESIRRR